MGKGNRMYITLNEKREKDKVIIEFLDKQYDAIIFIKSVLYEIAVSGIHCSPLTYKSDDISVEKKYVDGIKYGSEGANVCQREQKEENVIVDEILDDELMHLLE